MSETPDFTDESFLKSIIEIYEKVLVIQNLDAESHFFRLGGHSLLAIQVVAQIRKRLNVSIPVKEFFDHPTPASLVTYLTERED